MLKCVKYHGCGNDFIICEYDKEANYKEIALKVCNRYIGIGADTLIVIDPHKPEVWFYNADGTIAPMCGNGIRCVAAYLKEEGYVNSDEIIIETSTGKRKVYYEKNGLYRINMGVPSYNKEDLALEYEKDELFDEEYIYNGQKFNLNAIFFTTHHLVIPVNDLNIPDEVGEYFCNHPMFKQKINVNFVQIISEKLITIKTYERGCGWTKACGSGSTSSVAVLNRKGLVKDEVKVLFEYGLITIHKVNSDYYMIGPAVKIAEKINFID